MNPTQPHEMKLRTIANVSVIEESSCDYRYCGKIVATPIGVYGFVPSPDADKSLLGKLMPNHHSRGEVVWFERETIGIFNDLKPINGSVMSEKLKHLLTGYASRHSGQQIEALLAAGAIQKHGVLLEYAGEDNLRHKAMGRNLQLSAGDMEKLKSSLGALVPLMVSSSDIENMMGNESYVELIRKSMGHSNLLLHVDVDYQPKLLKMSLNPGPIDEIMMEAVAMEVARRSGAATPKYEIVEIKNPAGGIIHGALQENFALTTGVQVERRRMSIAAVLGKSDQDIHHMTYQEIGAAFSSLERNGGFSGPESEARVESNKEAVFRWALLNSAMNNTDNHGRNLEVFIDDNGKAQVTPMFDMLFNPVKAEMSTYQDGDPPIHTIDITNEDAVRALWDEIGLQRSSDNAIQISRQTISAMMEVPKICKELGLEKREMGYILEATGVQSKVLGDNLKFVWRVEMKNDRENVAGRDAAPSGGP